MITEHNQVTVTAPEQTICLSASHILAAAGSEPAILPIPGLSEPGVENSTSLLTGNRLYDHLVIIGGGVIGMEFAQYYSDFGKKSPYWKLWTGFCPAWTGKSHRT